MVAVAALQMAGEYQEGASSDPFAATGAFWAPLWLTFGVVTVTDYSFISAPVMWTYSFICTIGMVNLLVAMFADTFAMVKQDSEIEFQYDEAQRMFLYRDVVLSTPPLLNAPYIVYDVVIKMFARFGRVRERRNDLKEASGGKLGPSLHRQSTASSGLGSPTGTSDGPGEEHKQKDVNDGKTFVEALIKKRDKLAPETMQDIAASIVEGFDNNSRRRAEEYRHVDKVITVLQEQLAVLSMRVAFPLGARVVHAKHGVGTVVDHMVDTRTRVRFDDGGEHRYKLMALPSKVTRLCPVPEQENPQQRGSEAGSQGAAKLGK